MVDLKCVSGWGGRCSDVGRGSHGVSLWKHIWPGWITFVRCIRFEVGDGTRVCFWHDC